MAAIESTPSSDDNPTMTQTTEDPFASQHESDDPFAGKGVGQSLQDTAVLDSSLSPPNSPPARERRMSKEWDASKVPPSQFQKRKGSIYATPSSRDSHSQGGDRDKAYFEKLKEKGWNILKKRE